MVPWATPCHLTLAAPRPAAPKAPSQFRSKAAILPHFNSTAFQTTPQVSGAQIANGTNGAEWHTFSAWQGCNCSAIMSSLTVKRKCPHEGTCDIDAERADKASGAQQFDGGPYDHGAGSDFDGSERAPHQAYSGGLQQGTAQPHSLTAIEVADRPTLHRTRWRPTWWSWRGPDTRESTTRT